MLTREENERLTRVGPDTPMGTLMRRYWIPALYADQLAKPDCPPVRVKLLGESLVAFRDTNGRLGLLGEHCPHRTASLFFGRNEECGLRCVYHGWKFDVDGNCVDMPSEPAGTGFAHKIRIKSYPCTEQGGVVWTYMGPAALRPGFPALEWTLVPPSHRFASRHIQECNWLQGLEGGFDTSHLSFLHRGQADAGAQKVPSRYEVVPTDFGFVVGTGRDGDDDTTHWTANAMLMPFHKIIGSIPMGAHVWVPMDDRHTMLYSIDFNPDRPLTEADLAASKRFLHIHTENLPGSDRAARNKDNDYLIDRDIQASGASFTGLHGLAIQDSAIQESMGPIADRTQEHLGVSDTAIVLIRRLLMQTLADLESGTPLPGMEPASYRVRSARFTLPRAASFRDAVFRHVRKPAAVAAQ